MSLFITSLNSGSNGNCYYIGNEREAILVDAGISCRETEKRMARLGLSMQKVKAIFVSHEHSDHIRGIPILAKKFNLPVYITPGTLLHLGNSLDAQQVHHLREFETVNIGELQITSFPKEHDATEPHSFMVSCRDINVGVFTDIGVVCDRLIRYFSQCHAAFLEANYDDEMLDNGGYPYHLKRRIRGGKGHLSNKQALALFTTHKPPHMTHLLLSHLSHNNNNPQLVQDLFTNCADGINIIVASRFEETPVYNISLTEKTYTYAAQLNLGFDSF
ncbi:MBL fold metallo-hydrolase [Mucilaginibacter sp. SP1R1]|uniref:MBL fold metallo-hydrolase n=1 Tax=Mucilaginibacter sp. SP1R1 TaxID=2723091 RepID=UPI00161A8990|nr:MBL fold metallo-hydrolase [Mucilaginibacter sp. SP1R1]MBB6148641.1 phosphoribosyl 1,2-cyclic phosphodiesterase [Mucilaginibacter sp. SP1R1]